MNFVTTMERAVPMQPQNMMPSAGPRRLASAHPDRNPVVLLLLVLGFIAILWGTGMIKHYLDSSREDKAHTTIKSLPTILIMH